MKVFNKSLIFMVAILPLAGCATFDQLDGSASQQKQQQKILVTQKEEPISTKQNNKSFLSNILERKDDEVVKKDDKKESINSSENEKLIPILNDVPNKVKSNVVPDPNVSLIAPPTGLPRTSYAVPEVSEKENFVPQVAKTKCVVNKKTKKCVVQKGVSKNTSKDKSATVINQATKKQAVVKGKTTTVTKQKTTSSASSKKVVSKTNQKNVKK